MSLHYLRVYCEFAMSFTGSHLTNQSGIFFLLASFIERCESLWSTYLDHTSTCWCRFPGRDQSDHSQWAVRSTFGYPPHKASQSSCPVLPCISSKTGHKFPSYCRDLPQISPLTTCTYLGSTRHWLFSSSASVLCSRSSRWSIALGVHRA